MDTLIFDEVDTGISGAAANKVGQKLKQVSQNRQVLCITHLAQIAALADHHFLISKHVEGERTYTQVQGLDFEGRKREVARIIGGDQVTDLAAGNGRRNAEKGLTFPPLRPYNSSQQRRRNQVGAGPAAKRTPGW